MNHPDPASASTKRLLVGAWDVPRAQGAGLLQSRARNEAKWNEWLDEPVLTRPTLDWLDEIVQDRTQVPDLATNLALWLRLSNTKGNDWPADPARAAVYRRDYSEIHDWFIEQSRIGRVYYYVRGRRLTWRPLDQVPFGPARISVQEGLTHRLLAMHPFPSSQTKAITALGPGISRITQVKAYQEAVQHRARIAE